MHQLSSVRLTPIQFSSVGLWLLYSLAALWFGLLFGELLTLLLLIWSITSTSYFCFLMCNIGSNSPRDPRLPLPLPPWSSAFMACT